MRKPQTLAAKLCAIMKAVQRVAKRGTNELDDYNYATEGDVKEAFRLEMAKRNVIMLPNVLEEQRIPITLHLRGGDADSVVTRQRIKFTFHDGDSAEKIEASVWGAGEDAKDKGDYKCLTGALKSLLLTAFLLRSGDDPDQSADGGAVGKEIRQAKVEAAQEVGLRKLAIQQNPSSTLFYTHPEEANGHYMEVWGSDAALEAYKEPLMFHGKFINKTKSYKVPYEKIADLEFTLATNYNCKLKELKS